MNKIIRKIARALENPRVKSILYMSLSMALHYSGYEFTRNSILSLFTSQKTGFTSSSALPIATAYVAPFSFILVYVLYGMNIETKGPKYTLKLSTLCCSLTLIAASMILHSFLDLNEAQNNAKAARIRIMHQEIDVKYFTFFLYLFQNSYCSLLHTQYWSFFGSILSPSEGTTFFAPIAGVSTVASTFSAGAISKLAPKIGLSGLLCSGGLSLLLSYISVDKAYFIAEKHGFSPSSESVSKNKEKRADSDDNKNTNGSLHSMSHKAQVLFRRVPVLSALFMEVLTRGFLTSVLNVSYTYALREAIKDDAERAGYSGIFHALANGVSGILQFGPLSMALHHVEMSWISIVMPLLPLFLSFFQLCFRREDPSLLLITSSYLVLKTLEYSVLGVTTEIVYSSLDYESRFFGKEIIDNFGNRLGRSVCSIGLILYTKYIKEIDSSTLSVLTFICASSWFLSGAGLSRLVLTREEYRNISISSKRISEKSDGEEIVEKDKAQ